MSQSAEVKLDGKTTVPEAVDKSKKAMVSFEKQVEDIQKKFSTAFKDIFLGFTAPMVIIQNVIGAISDAIAKAKQDAKEGLDLLAKGETLYATDEEKKMANFFRAKQMREDEMKLAQKGKEEMAKQYMDTAEGGKIALELAKKFNVAPQGMESFMSNVHNLKEFQDKAVKSFLASPEGRAFQPIFDAQAVNPNTFNAPQINSVVGMGSNAAMQAQLDLVDESRKQTALLEQIAQGGGTTPPDFTKDPKKMTSPWTYQK